MPSSRRPVPLSPALRLVQREARLVQLRPLDEQLDRRRPDSASDPRAAHGTGNGCTSRSARPARAARSRLVVRIAHVGRAAQDRAGELGARTRRPARSCRGSAAACAISDARRGLHQRPARLFANAEDARRLAGDQRTVADRLQVDEPDAVRISHPCTLAPICSASRVLPRPPMPSSVSSRVARQQLLISCRSRSRPMNVVSCCGRLFGVASSSRSAGKFWYSFG